MGSFYLNTTFVGTDLEAVLRAVSGPALAFADGDCVTVFSEADEAMFEAGVALATAALGCPALSVTVHDSDILAYEVHADGTVVTRGAVPDPGDYFDEDLPPLPSDPTALVDALGRGDVERTAAALAGFRSFAEDRHAELVTALGLPVATVGWGYRYLQEERSRFAGPDLVEIPPA